jgi:Flp pilus assembly pilin Flp
MHRVLFAVAHLVRDDRGQDLVEYGFLVTLIALAVLLAVGLFGTATNTLWSPIDTFVQAI